MRPGTGPGDSPGIVPTGAPLRRPAAFEARFTAGFVGRLAADSMAFARSNARSSQLRRQVSTSPRGSISAPRPVTAPSAGTVGSPRWWHPTLRAESAAAAEAATARDAAPAVALPAAPAPAPSAPAPSAPASSAPAPTPSPAVQRPALPPRRDLSTALPARGLPRVVQRVPDEKTWTPGSFSQTTAPKPIPMRLPAEVRAAGSMMTPQDRRRRPSPQETRPGAAEPAPGKSSGASTQPTAARTGAAAGSRARQATPQVPSPRAAPTRSTPPPVRRFLRRRALAARIVGARTEQAQQTDALRAAAQQTARASGGPRSAPSSSSGSAPSGSALSGSTLSGAATLSADSPSARGSASVLDPAGHVVHAPAHGTALGAGGSGGTTAAGPMAPPVPNTENHAPPSLLRRALLGGAGLLDRQLRGTTARRSPLGAPVAAGAGSLQRGTAVGRPPRRALEAVTDRAASTGLTTLAATTPHRALGTSARASAPTNTTDTTDAAGSAPQRRAPSVGERPAAAVPRPIAAAAQSPAPRPVAAPGQIPSPRPDSARRPVAARASRPVGTIARGPSLVDLGQHSHPSGAGQAARGAAPQSGRPASARFTPSPAGRPATIRRMPLTHARPSTGPDTAQHVSATSHLAARRRAGAPYQLGAAPGLPRGIGAPLAAAPGTPAPAARAAASTSHRRPLVEAATSRPVTATAASRSAAVASPTMLTAAPLGAVASRTSHTRSAGPPPTATAGDATDRLSLSETRSSHDAGPVVAGRPRALVGAAVGPLRRSIQPGPAHDAQHPLPADARAASPHGSHARAAVGQTTTAAPSASSAAHLEGALLPIARTTLRRWAGSAPTPVRSTSADAGASVGTLTRVAGATGRGSRSTGGAGRAGGAGHASGAGTIGTPGTAVRAGGGTVGPGRGAHESTSLSAFRPGRSVVPSRGGTRPSGGAAPTWQVESAPLAARDGTSPATPGTPRPTRPRVGPTGGRDAADRPDPRRGTASAAPAILRWASVRPAPRVVGPAPVPGSHRSTAAGPGPGGRTSHGAPPPVPDDTAAQLSVLRSITGRQLTGPQGSIPDEGRTMSDGPRIGQHRARAAGGALGVGPGAGDPSIGDMEQRVLESLDRRITARLDGELAQIIEDRVVRRVEDRLLEALDRSGSGSTGVF